MKENFPAGERRMYLCFVFSSKTLNLYHIPHQLIIISLYLDRLIAALHTCLVMVSTVIKHKTELCLNSVCPSCVSIVCCLHTLITGSKKLG